MADLVTITLPQGTRISCDAELARKFQQAEPEQPPADQPPADQKPEDLKGEALDAALKEAGLPVSGSADEKRARLAEHLAAQANEQN